MTEPASDPRPLLAQTAQQERDFLWGLAFRITGVAADAEDVVQETLTRLLVQPPPDLSAPLRPWLVRVASRLAIDVLRRRRRQSYIGPWLPSPVLDCEPAQAGARYEARESLTFAFLLALEALPPTQRAVVVLRDVLDLDVRETAQALSMRESNVKVTHLRARRRLQDYDQQRIDTSAAAQARVQDALMRLLAAIAQQDVQAVAALLSDQVVMYNDAGGQYLSARKPVRGRKSVSLFLVKVPRLGGSIAYLPQLRPLAGLPALFAQAAEAPRAGIAQRFVLGIELDASGRIAALYNVLADRKLPTL